MTCQVFRQAHGRPVARARGFTLIEMAVMLAVLGLLLGGLLAPLRSQVDASRYERARVHLEEVRVALVGYLLFNGRLPCPDDDDPAAPDVDGEQDPSQSSLPSPPATVTCDREEGILPWAELGVEARDPWGNLLRYRPDPAFVGVNGLGPTVATTTDLDEWGAWPAGDRPRGMTVTDRLRTVEFLLIMVDDLAKNSTIEDDPYVVHDSPSGTIAPGSTLTAANPNAAAFLVFSCGKNGIADSANNGDNSGAAADGCGYPGPVDDLYTQDVFTEGEDVVFDDVLVWVSKHALLGRLASAGLWPEP